MLQRHPRLIYCSIWAFGYNGPLKMKPGFDPLLQAYGGMMTCTGRGRGSANLCGASINDKATGMFCTIGAAGSAPDARQDGQGLPGRHLAVRLGGALGRGQVNNYLASGEVPKRHGTGGAIIVPYQTFDTADRAALPGARQRPAVGTLRQSARPFPNGRPICATPRARRG